MKKEDFIIYRYHSSEPMLVAVDPEHEAKIRHVIDQFGSLAKAPHDWEVRGIFINTEEEKEPDFEPNGQQIEILIANLRERLPPFKS